MQKGTGNYAIVEQVRIKDVTADTVTFETRSEGRTPEECALRNFQVPRAEVYEHQPPGGPEPVKLAANQQGIMYLSEAGWTVTSDGLRIYGAGTAEVVFKWPEHGSAPEMAFDQLEIVPTSIRVRGTCVRNGRRGPIELDLLGDDCAVGQNITWNGAAEIEVRTRTELLSIWPTSIEVFGSPKRHPALTGAVDLLDVEQAGRTQQLTWRAHGEPVRLTLTQDGFSRFHVVPELANTSAA